jgi:hypothetical protein
VSEARADGPLNESVTSSRPAVRTWSSNLSSTSATGRVIGVEAMSRFSVEPKRGPDFWFDEALKAGLGLDLELAALVAAVGSADPLLAAGLRVSVNLSP